MLASIKKKTRRKLISKVYAGKTNGKAFPTLSSIKSVGIIANEGFDHKLAKFGFLCAVNSNILLITNEIRPKNHTDEKLYVSDLNFWGLPKPHVIDWFVSKPFDILIDMTSNNTDFIEYICAKSVAKFKVAKNKSAKAYELIIQQAGLSDTGFINEIENAIKGFNSTK